MDKGICIIPDCTREAWTIVRRNEGRATSRHDVALPSYCSPLCGSPGAAREETCYACTPAAQAAPLQLARVPSARLTNCPVVQAVLGIAVTPDSPARLAGFAAPVGP